MYPKMRKKKTNVMDKVLKILLVILGMWFVFGVIGLLIADIYNYNGDFRKVIGYSAGLWIFVSFVVYVILEFLLLYYRKNIFGFSDDITNDITTFGSFMKNNFIIAAMSFMFGLLYFTVIYFIRNIKRGFISVWNALNSGLSKLGVFLTDNVWVIDLIGIVIVVVLFKYILYKVYRKRRR